jgi:predicted nucleic acid-binding protein
LSAVVDASALVAALVDSGPDGAWSEAILNAGGLNAPELVYVETANVLRKLANAGRISQADAGAAFEDLMQLPLALHPFEPFADRIWELRHALTGYDAWYVALAEALSLPMATLDGRITRSKVARCKFLVP